MRTIWCILFSLLLMGAFPGCGGDDENGGADQPSQGAPSGNTAPSAPAPPD